MHILLSTCSTAENSQTYYCFVDLQVQSAAKNKSVTWKS